MYAGLPYEDYDIITKNGDIERSNNEDKRRDIIGSIHFLYSPVRMLAMTPPSMSRSVPVIFLFIYCNNVGMQVFSVSL